MYFILDFDSTIIQAESLDVLAEICGCSADVRGEIALITDLGMKGEISIQDSLSRRIRLINANINDMSELIARLRPFISPSLNALKSLRDIFPEKCFVISGGFMEYILTLCLELGFKEDRIIANQFVVKDDRIVDFNRDLTIAQNLGKVRVIRELNLQEPICMIGDGYTDFETKREGCVDYFLAFTETVYRHNVVLEADTVCKNFYEVINFFNEKQK